MAIVKTAATASELARSAGQIRTAFGVDPTFDVQRGDRVVTISGLRGAVTPKGNPSLNTILLNEDGRSAAYDGSYIFDVVGYGFHRGTNNE